MDEDLHTTDKQHKWFSVGKQLLSFAAGIVVASFILGGARQKMFDLQKWKEEVAPRIERMDRQGSISFDNFKSQYDKEQHNQYERLKKLEEEVGHLETMTHRIERLERNGQSKEPRPE